MNKVLVIQLDSSVIPETEIGKVASVTIEARNYTGKAVAIVVYATEEAVSTKVTLEAVGLKTTAP